MDKPNDRSAFSRTLHQLHLALLTPDRSTDAWASALAELIRLCQAKSGGIVQVDHTDGPTLRILDAVAKELPDSTRWLNRLGGLAKSDLARLLDQPAPGDLRSGSEWFAIDLASFDPEMSQWCALPCRDQSGQLTAFVVLQAATEPAESDTVEAISMLRELIGAAAAMPETITPPIHSFAADDEAFYRSVLDLVEQIVVVYDLRQYYPVYSNPYALRFLGFDPGISLEILKPEPYLHPDDRPMMEQVIQALRQSNHEGPMSYTGRLRDHQGLWQWVRFNVSVYKRDSSGSVSHVIGIGYELSKTEQTQLGLEDANNPQALVEVIPDLIFRLNREGYFLETKESISEELIAQPRDFIGKHFREVLPESVGTQLEVEWDNIFERRETFTLEYELALPDGEHQWFEARLIPTDDSEVVTVVRNMTDRRSREVALLREIDFRDALIRTASEGIAVATMIDDGRDIQFLVWNDRMIEITGYTKDEVNSMPWMEKLFPDPEVHLEIINCIRETCAGRPYQCEELAMLSRRGEEKVVLASGAPAPLQGQQVGFMTMMQDITPRREAEQQLQDSQQFITRIADASPDFIYVFDLQDQKVVYANRRVEQALGFSQEDISGEGAISFIDLLHPEDATRLTQLFSRWETADDDAILETEYRLRASNGQYYNFWGRDTVFQRDSTGRVKRIIGTAKDVTAWKSAESAVRDNEERLRTMLEALENVAVWAHDKAQVITFWNRACESLYGIPVNEAMGEKLDRVFRLRDGNQQITSEDASQCRNGEGHPPTAQLEFQRADGTMVTVYSSCVEHELPERSVEYFYFDVDITSHRQAEAELAIRRAELAHVSRLTTMGQMAAELSHEIAQPLSAIGNFSSACERILAAPEYAEALQLRGYVKKISDQTNRCGEILHRLRDFGRRSTFVPEPCSPEELVRDSLAFVASEMRGRKISTTVESNGLLPTIQCDRVLMQQVFVNLLTNAMDALESSNSVDKKISIRTCRQNGEVTFEFRDNGPGLGEAQGKDVFEPFFTTKSSGMGIGLSICKAIVEEHRGSISAESLQPQGARFRVALPIAVAYDKSTIGSSHSESV